MRATSSRIFHLGEGNYDINIKDISSGEDNFEDNIKDIPSEGRTTLRITSTSTSRISHLEEDNLEVNIYINIEDVPSEGRTTLRIT